MRQVFSMILVIFVIYIVVICAIGQYFMCDLDMGEQMEIVISDGDYVCVASHIIEDEVRFNIYDSNNEFIVQIISDGSADLSISYVQMYYLSEQL